MKGDRSTLGFVAAIVIVGAAAAAYPLFRARSTVPRRHYLNPDFTYVVGRGGPPDVLIEGHRFHQKFFRLGGLRIRTNRIHTVDRDLSLEGDDLPRRVPVPTGEFPVWFCPNADAYSPASNYAQATRKVLVIPFRDEVPARWFMDLHGIYLNSPLPPGERPHLHLGSGILAVLDEQAYPRYREAFSGLTRAFEEAGDAARLIAEEYEVLAQKRTPDPSGHAYWRERGLRINQPHDSDGVLVRCGTDARVFWGVNARDETVCLVILSCN
jgi:hypothetical protein